MKRRSFFKSLAKAAAVVALAPQIAFGVKAEIAAVTSMSTGAITSPVFYDISTPIMWSYMRQGREVLPL